MPMIKQNKAMADDDEKFSQPKKSASSKSRRKEKKSRNLQKKAITKQEVIKLTAVRQRCISRSRRYTINDLVQLRSISSYREMPTNIICEAPELLSPGLGVKTHPNSPLSRQIMRRSKQIDITKQTIGYQHYISMIPKSERIPSVHPSTPKFQDVKSSSKRRFDSHMRTWKKAIHTYDNIESESELPFYLLTHRMRDERSLSSINNPTNIGRKWSPKKSPKKSPSKQQDVHVEDEEYGRTTNFRSPSPVKTRKAIYSPTKNQWFVPKSADRAKHDVQRKKLVFENDDSSGNDDGHTLLTKNEYYDGYHESDDTEQNDMIPVSMATKCLRKSIESLKIQQILLQNNDTNDNDMATLLLNQFNQEMLKYTAV